MWRKEFRLGNILIAYFSRPGNNYVDGRIVDLPVGNTELVAHMIAARTGGDLFRLDPENPYPDDYAACTEAARRELYANARPALAAYPENVGAYGAVFLGYPNWWGTMPMPVWTLLSRYDFLGKAIHPFCTHEGSGLGRSEEDIKALCPGADVKKGLAIRGGGAKGAAREVEIWLARAGIR